MKKLLLTLPVLALLLFAPHTHAGQCFGETPADYYVKVTSAVNLRDAVCEGKVIDSLTTGLVVHAIADLDGWVQVEYNGKKGFVWGDFVEKINTSQTPSASQKGTLWDVGDHAYQQAIWNLYNAGIVKGNDTDGSYQPDSPINRAAFATLALRATTPLVPKSDTGCLKDIAPGMWYTDFICYANRTLINGEPIIKGHPDGYFRPGDNIRFSEFSKILSLLYGLKTGQGQQWYEGYIQALSDVNAIPPTLKYPEQLVTRAEMAEVIDRLMQQDSKRSSTKFNYTIQMPGESTIAPPSTNLASCLEDAAPSNTDYQLVAAKALELTNQARSQKGLTALNKSEMLNASSMIWALQGQFTHDRPNGQNLGDYEKSIGVTSFTAFAENLGQSSFNCQEQDCTQQALTTLETIHQLFMDEEKLPEGQRGHFENIMGDYQTMGFGLSVQNGKMLLVFQYAKGIDGDEQKLCTNLK